MADFRRCFIAFAVLALMASLASAQIGTAGSTQAGPLTCTGNAAATPQLRSEGYTELVGDVLITCTGGQYSTVGAQILTTNITVYVTPNIPITSRLFAGGSTGVSEALLIIDDAGSALPTGATGPYGPRAPQVVCPDTASTGGCPAYVGLDNSGTYYVATSTPGGGTNAANVYQGNLNQVGTNSVTFYGVPSLPPVTTGVSRTFRITNVRVPTVGMGNQATIQVYVSTSPSQLLPVSLASLQVGIVADPGLKTAIYASGFTKTSQPIPNFQQCAGQGPTPSVDLVYTEGFATSFKTRMVPLSNTLWASQNQGNNLGSNPGVNAQNIPGGTYAGFAANSESGLIQPSLTGANGNTTYTAGLADFGTRLKAVFTNIPAGITIYVSGGNKEALGQYAATVTGTNTPAGATGILGGTSTASAAVLWSPSSGGNGETTRDGTSFTPGASLYGIQTYSTSGLVSTALNTTTLVPNSSGVATAIWEVVNSNPSTVENYTFTVYIGYPSNPGGGITSSNPYGLPQITSILGQPVNNVALSFAPEPSQGAFSASSATVPGTNPIPRFAVVHPFSGPFVSIVLCQTTLLYPFVTANPAGGLGQGFDTGIAVANTSVDPFTKLLIPTTPMWTLNSSGTPSGGTVPQTGSCSLYPYGVSISATGVQTAAPNPLPGCDTITNPVPGTNCFPVVNPGSVQTVLASQVFPTFQGYVIAVCNFQYAHGYAAVTDLGLRGLFSSYLAIELENCQNYGGACVGLPRGVSIEWNSH